MSRPWKPESAPMRQAAPLTIPLLCSTCKKEITGTPRHRNGPAAWCSDVCFALRKVVPLRLTASKVAKAKPVKIPPEREKAIQAAIIDAIHLLYKRNKLVRWARNNVGGWKDRQGTYVAYGLGVGSPDLILCVRGRFVGLEVKTEAGELSDEQEAWHCGWKESGAVVEVVRSPVEAVAVINKILRGE